MVYIFLFLIGLAVGSFLNVVIYRLHAGKSFLFSRSHCPKCKKILAWYDLIPLVSFALTKGKCRYCEKKISWQYPLVELSTAVLFMSAGWFVFEGFFYQSLFYYFFLSALIIIFVYDLKHFIIPDKIVYPAIAIALIYNLIRDYNSGSLFTACPVGAERLFGVHCSLFTGILAAGIAGGFFLALVLISSGRWMGLGDVKMACFMGLLLGWPNILAALMTAFVLGGVVGLGLILTKKKVFKSQLPFGPFLSAATLISIFWGDKLVNWYLNFIGY